MSENISTSEKKRRRKRTRIYARLEELRYEVPTVRTRTMNKEFGPYWYFLLPEGGQIPMVLKEKKRYLNWGLDRNLQRL